MSNTGPPPNVTAPPPPPGWPTLPPPKRSGLPTWAVVLIVVVVVAVVALAAIFLAAVLFVLGTPLEPGTTRPALTFGSAQAVTNGFEFQVAGISQSLPAATYRVALSTNGTAAGTARTLSAAMTFGEYTITWTDLGGEGRLTAGDSFRVTRTGGVPANTDFVVSVLWTDGAAVGSRDYST